MQIIPIKTRIMLPPKDDLFEVLNESLSGLQNSDIVVITSKVVSIGEGRCLPIGSVEKRVLIEAEAEATLDEGDRHPLTIKNHAFISSAGVDESNGNGHYILLPKDAFNSANNIHSYLKKRHHLKKLGVIITDSHSLPFRYGAMSVAIGYWGFQPLVKYVGKPDLFGRKFSFERSNLVDAIAAGAGLVLGEGSEQTPVAIVRGVERIKFTDSDTRKDFLIPPKEDIYYPLLKKLYGNKSN
jgi:F420-0:gamma-glutamyl ligase